MTAAERRRYSLDLEGELPPAPPPSLLRFQLPPALTSDDDDDDKGSGDPGGSELRTECAGFIFSSRFFFHEAADTLDTFEQPTHWGTLFVPFSNLSPAPAADSPSGYCVELRTEMPDSARPSSFDLLARCCVDGNSRDTGGGWQRCGASVRTGLAAHEHFM